MPTVGWIQEDAWERYWEGRQKRRPTPILRHYYCPICGHELPGEEALAQHYMSAHPLDLPSLRIGGQGIPQEFTVRAPLEVSEIKLLSCESCEVRQDLENWEMIPPRELLRRLSAARSGVWQLRLKNTRVADEAHSMRQHKITFKIPDPEILATIDRLFVRELARDCPRRKDLETFQAHLPESSAEREYGGALGNYAMAVFLKESPPVNQHLRVLEEAISRFKEALAVLQYFERPVTSAVTAAIRLNLNDFGDGAVLGPPDLELTIEVFRSLARGTDSPPCGGQTTEKANPICPVDRATHHLITGCVAFHEGSVTQEEVASVRRISAGMASELDRSKAQALIAAIHLQQGNSELAFSHLRTLRFDSVFGEWAESRLSRGQD